MTNLKRYDLEDRTFTFAKDIITISKRIPTNIITYPLISQVVRSGTSIGANYREANETDTKKDFRNRIRIAKKEAKETVYWLQLLAETIPELKIYFDRLSNEAMQFVKILASIYEKTKSSR
jgi:four helix bundle protein